MSIEQRISNLEDWKEAFINTTDTLVLDAESNREMIERLMKEVFSLKAAVQVLAEEVAFLKRQT